MNLKHLYQHIAALLALVFLSGGCDFLDTKIDTDLTEDALVTNRNTIWNFGNAMYSPMISGYYALDGNFFAAASDEAQRTQESGNTYIFNRGTLSPDNVGYASANVYSNYYEGIRAANFFLEYAKEGENFLALNRDTANDRINYERDVRNLQWYRAEAHVARAFYYSELIKRFGGVPIIETVMEKDANPGQVSRASYEEVVQYIVGEIDACKDQLQTDWDTHPDNVSRNDGRFERKAALAIKARVLLYAASALNNPANDKSKWEQAARAAHDVMEEMNYTLPPNRNYGTYFTGNNAAVNPESIFLIRHGTNNDVEKANYPIATQGGNSGVTPTENLVAAYEYIGEKDPVNPYKNRDPRLNATVVCNGTVWNEREIDQSPGGSDDRRMANTSKTGYYLKKFLKDNLNLVLGGTEYHVWVVYRYAEVLLNYAEAMTQAYGTDVAPAGFTLTAREALRQVRNSASTSLPPVTTTQPDEFIEAIKRERRVELAFEDHRYWDLLRWKEAESVLNRPVQGVAISKDENGTYSYQVVNAGERVFHTRNYYMPFSRAEIVNSGGTLTQNEGY
jgi:hypothetical protein